MLELDVQKTFQKWSLVISTGEFEQEYLRISTFYKGNLPKSKRSSNLNTMLEKLTEVVIENTAITLEYFDDGIVKILTVKFNNEVFHNFIKKTLRDILIKSCLCVQRYFRGYIIRKILLKDIVDKLKDKKRHNKLLKDFNLLEFINSKNPNEIQMTPTRLSSANRTIKTLEVDRNFDLLKSSDKNEPISSPSKSSKKTTYIKQIGNTQILEDDHLLSQGKEFPNEPIMSPSLDENSFSNSPQKSLYPLSNDPELIQDEIYSLKNQLASITNELQSYKQQIQSQAITQQVLKQQQLIQQQQILLNNLSPFSKEKFNSNIDLESNPTPLNLSDLSSPKDDAVTIPSSPNNLNSLQPISKLSPLKDESKSSIVELKLSSNKDSIKEKEDLPNDTSLQIDNTSSINILDPLSSDRFNSTEQSSPINNLITASTRSQDLSFGITSSRVSNEDMKSSVTNNNNIQQQHLFNSYLYQQPNNFPNQYMQHPTPNFHHDHTLFLSSNIPQNFYNQTYFNNTHPLQMSTPLTTQISPYHLSPILFSQSLNDAKKSINQINDQILKNDQKIEESKESKKEKDSKIIVESPIESINSDDSNKKMQNQTGLNNSIDNQIKKIISKKIMQILKNDRASLDSLSSTIDNDNDNIEVNKNSDSKNNNFISQIKQELISSIKEEILNELILDKKNIKKEIKNEFFNKNEDENEKDLNNDENEENEYEENEFEENEYEEADTISDNLSTKVIYHPSPPKSLPKSQIIQSPRFKNVENLESQKFQGKNRKLFEDHSRAKSANSISISDEDSIFPEPYSNFNLYNSKNSSAVSSNKFNSSRPFSSPNSFSKYTPNQFQNNNFSDNIDNNSYHHSLAIKPMYDNRLIEQKFENTFDIDLSPESIISSSNSLIDSIDRTLNLPTSYNNNNYYPNYSNSPNISPELNYFTSNNDYPSSILPIIEYSPKYNLNSSNEPQLKSINYIYDKGQKSLYFDMNIGTYNSIGKFNYDYINNNSAPTYYSYTTRSFSNSDSNPSYYSGFGSSINTSTENCSTVTNPNIINNQMNPIQIINPIPNVNSELNNLKTILIASESLPTPAIQINDELLKLNSEDQEEKKINAAKLIQNSFYSKFIKKDQELIKKKYLELKNLLESNSSQLIAFSILKNIMAFAIKNYLPTLAVSVLNYMNQTLKKRSTYLTSKSRKVMYKEYYSSIYYHFLNVFDIVYLGFNSFCSIFSFTNLFFEIILIYIKIISKFIEVSKKSSSQIININFEKKKLPSDINDSSFQSKNLLFKFDSNFLPCTILKENYSENEINFYKDFIILSPSFLIQTILHIIKIFSCYEGNEWYSIEDLYDKNSSSFSNANENEKVALLDGKIIINLIYNKNLIFNSLQLFNKFFMILFCEKYQNIYNNIVNKQIDEYEISVKNSTKLDEDMINISNILPFDIFKVLLNLIFINFEINNNQFKDNLTDDPMNLFEKLSLSASFTNFYELLLQLFYFNIKWSCQYSIINKKFCTYFISLIESSNFAHQYFILMNSYLVSYYNYYSQKFKSTSLNKKIKDKLVFSNNFLHLNILILKEFFLTENITYIEGKKDSLVSVSEYFKIYLALPSSNLKSPSNQKNNEGTDLLSDEKKGLNIIQIDQKKIIKGLFQFLIGILKLYISFINNNSMLSLINSNCSLSSDSYTSLDTVLLENIFLIINHFIDSNSFSKIYLQLNSYFDINISIFLLFLIEKKEIILANTKQIVDKDHKSELINDIQSQINDKSLISFDKLLKNESINTSLPFFLYQPKNLLLNPSDINFLNLLLKNSRKLLTKQIILPPNDFIIQLKVFVLNSNNDGPNLISPIYKNSTSNSSCNLSPLINRIKSFLIFNGIILKKYNAEIQKAVVNLLSKIDSISIKKSIKKDNNN